MLAAGEGRRMRPLSDRWPKALMPIDREPVLARLLRELAAAGIRRATVVVGRFGEAIEELVGDGRAFGLEVRYARQPEPVGSADALRRALEAGAEPPLAVSAADTVYARGDVASACARFLRSAAAGALAVRAVPAAELAERSAVRVEAGRLFTIGGTSRQEPGRAGALAAAPLWLLRAALVPYVEAAEGPPFELAAAFQRAIDDGLSVLALEIGATRDVTRPEDVLRHNFAWLN